MAEKAQSGTKYVRNISKGAVADFIDGARVVIEAGEVGEFPADRIAPHGPSLEPATKGDFDAQEHKKEAAAKARGLLR